MDLLLVSLNNGGKLYGVNSSNVISVVITWFTWWSYHNDIHLKVDQFTQSMHIFTGDQTWSYNIPIAFLTHINKLSFESLREFTGYVDFKFYFKIYTIYWKTVWNIIYWCLCIIKTAKTCGQSPVSLHTMLGTWLVWKYLLSICQCCA